MAWYDLTLERDNGDRIRVLVEAFYYPGSNQPDDFQEWTVEKILDFAGRDLYKGISESEADRIEESLERLR